MTTLDELKKLESMFLSDDPAQNNLAWELVNTMRELPQMNQNQRYIVVYTSSTRMKNASRTAYTHWFTGSQNVYKIHFTKALYFRGWNGLIALFARNQEGIPSFKINSLDLVTVFLHEKHKI